jgi:hypothetical protein
MGESKQTTPTGKDHPSGYEQLLDRVRATAPKVGKALVRAYENRIKQLNRYLNEDTLGKYFPGSYFAGLEEVYAALEVIREMYERSEALKGISFLLKRVRADFESAIDAGLAGFNGVVLDTMRDVMEVEYLLRDFLHDKQQIRRWLNADRAMLIKEFGPAALRRRQAAACGTVPEKLPDVFEYRLHSEGLHVSPTFILDDLAGKGFTEAPNIRGVEFCFAEMFEHARRVILAAHDLGMSIEGAQWTGSDPRTCMPEAAKAWARARNIIEVMMLLERAAQTGDSIQSMQG